jgi:hypothetical protein
MIFLGRIFSKESETINVADKLEEAVWERWQRSAEFPLVRGFASKKRGDKSVYTHIIVAPV